MITVSNFSSKGCLFFSFASLQYFYSASNKVGGTISPESALLLCPSKTESELQSPVQLEIVAIVTEGKSWKISLKHILSTTYPYLLSCENSMKWDSHFTNFLLRTICCMRSAQRRDAAHQRQEITKDEQWMSVCAVGYKNGRSRRNLGCA